MTSPPPPKIILCREWLTFLLNSIAVGLPITPPCQGEEALVPRARGAHPLVMGGRGECPPRTSLSSSSQLLLISSSLVVAILVVVVLAFGNHHLLLLLCHTPPNFLDITTAEVVTRRSASTHQWERCWWLGRSVLFVFFVYITHPPPDQSSTDYIILYRSCCRASTIHCCE